MSQNDPQANAAALLYEADFALHVVRFGQMAEFLVSHAAFGTLKVPEAHNGEDGDSISQSCSDASSRCKGERAISSIWRHTLAETLRCAMWRRGRFPRHDEPGAPEVLDQPLGGNRGHEPVRVVMTFPAIEAQRERQRLRQFLRDGGA